MMWKAFINTLRKDLEDAKARYEENPWGSLAGNDVMTEIRILEAVVRAAEVAWAAETGLPISVEVKVEK
jgi:hypothetical protein